METKEIPFLTIRQLSESYHSENLSPVEVTQLILERAVRLDGKLNAFNLLLKEEANRQAEQITREFQKGIDKGLLHGVPFSLKDILDTNGIPTTASSNQWRTRRPEQTATSAQRLLDAGGILIGKCNLLEFAYGIVHPDFGQTNNPWDTGRTSGGSSGGSAASIAAGVGWASLGTDTGGSIRIPAAYCGVVGFKPTYGRISRHGVFPLSWSLDHVGVLARCVEDVAVVMNIVSGYDPLDRTSLREPFSLGLPELERGLEGLKIGVVVQHVDHPDLDTGVRDRFLGAARELEKLGAVLQPVHIPTLAQAWMAKLVTMLVEAAVVHKQMLAGSPEKYAQITRQQLELGALVPATRYVEAQQVRTKLLEDYLRVFEQVDLLISPTVGFEAPEEDPVVAAGEGSAESRGTAPYNLVGLPAISVPCGFGGSNLPVGFQIAGPPLADALVLQVAYQYEQAAGWHRLHPAL